MKEHKPPSPALFAELQALIDVAHHGDIRGDQMRRLEQLLRDSEVRDLYLELVWESDVVATWAKESEEERLAAVRQPPRATVLGFLHSSLYLAGRAVARHPLAAALLALVVAVPLIAWFASSPSPPQVAADEGGSRPPRTIESRPTVASEEPVEAAGEEADEGPSPIPRRHIANPVARLARTVDCAWASGRDAQSFIEPEAGDDLAAGQKFMLTSGLAEIVFQDGARAILQGPAMFEVRSRTCGVLSRGKCSVTAETPLAHGFEIRAPGMKYTDLGTEFGVAVTENGVQEVHVFRGKVQAERRSEREKARRGEAENAKSAPLPVSPSPPLVLAAHEAIRVAAPVAVGKAAVPVERMAADEQQFVRALPPATALDLVDIVAGGDGLSTRRNREINPTNGRFGDEPGGHDNIAQGDGTVFRSDHQYHRVPGNLSIDGVFIVHGGRGPVQLDSAGHCFADFPKNDGKTANMIQAVGATSARPHAWFTAKQNSLPQLGGVDYSSIGHGVLAVRSNKGITFDLAAVRAAHPGYCLLSFTAVAGNSHRENTPRPGAFWVFVDGQLRFQRPNVVVNSGPVPIDIALQPADRYLTLVVTTPTANGIWNGTMFGDPKLKLAAIDKSPADAKKAD